MLEKNGIKEFIVVCDTCGEEYDSGTREFYEMLDGLRDLGWRTYKELDTWMHKCAECFDEENYEEL